MANLAKHEEQLVIEHVPIGDLRPHAFNPRRISSAELEPLTRSRQSFGRLIARHYEGIVLHGPLQTGAGGRDRGKGGQKFGGFEPWTGGGSRVCASPD